MKKTTSLLALLALTAPVLAQTDAGKRLITIEGAPRGDVRNGPLNFTGNPVKAKVSTLNIEASQAVLAAPKGTALIEVKGKRTADFTGNVKVVRGRLTATGNALAYSEATGQGVLNGSASATFTPDKTDGDTVTIKAAQMSLDVDNDRSTSTGGVTLSNVRRGVAQAATLGYWVGEPHARMGYISRAVRTVTRFCFDRLRLHRIEAACLPSNVPSRDLLLKVGFSLEGKAVAYLKINGAWRDHLLFGLVNDEAGWGEDHKSGG